LGKDHIYTLSTHRRLTRLLVELHKYEDALPLLQSCLELHNAKFGPAAGLTFGVRQSLAAALEGLERYDDAETFMQETVNILAEQRGEDHSYTQEAREALARFRASHPK
jgi:hypothetical protein